MFCYSPSCTNSILCKTKDPTKVRRSCERRFDENPKKTQDFNQKHKKTSEIKLILIQIRGLISDNFLRFQNSVCLCSHERRTFVISAAYERSHERSHERRTFVLELKPGTNSGQRFDEQKIKKHFLFPKCLGTTELTMRF